MERLSWLCETDDIGRIGALCEFKVLRKIKVDYDMFLHRYLTVEDMEERVQSLLQVLPSSFEELELVRCMSRGRTVGMLAELVKLKKHDVPKLTKVIFDCSGPLHDAARDACKEVGIDLGVTNSRLERPGHIRYCPRQKDHGISKTEYRFL